ncbi:hypothetical protein BU24DRAFT_477225 [Aaosphaeria arxii CBS 175.79]|uniref:Xylanolytic transcriptional activator regulatory domain-containing protein n=1 Tax=Aaosphaeria arxii CBS 175.79 TaxID=1450172 RepID=A0A6A5Y4F2_9PLEO|nr:uncharacterized protein BU24DRAFT_477225 [Aaosphaeria arxii CBS 175.79]KAF2020083.1 hypothetical protein BU24DRAFT_477225 [Aaosphaeria arxii CBS 175.79]
MHFRPSVRWEKMPTTRGRSVSVKFIDKLQQRIQSLEALSQDVLNSSAWRPNDHDARSPSDAPVLPCSPNTTQRDDTRPTSSEIPRPATPAASAGSHGSHPNIPVAMGISAKSPRTVRGESPTFYGATSHPHVASPGEESRLTSSECVDTVGIELDASSPRLRDHLLRSFFKYQTLWVDIVNKDAFLSHQATATESRWYSKFLEDAMLACGSRLSTSASVRALGTRYFEWAKEGALRALTEPTPANLQGFLLLSEYEVTQGNDRTGWMFCGVACRMLSDLGLHKFASVTGLTRKAQDSNNESNLAYALLSACIVYEGVWTLYLGRPSSIPQSFMNAAASRSRMGLGSDSPWLNAWVGLCVPMAQVSHVLNEQSISDFDRSDSLRKLLKQIEEWYDDLPPGMTYDDRGLTNMDLAGYGLHSQYCKVQNLVRQALATPQNTRKRRRSQLTSDVSPPATATDSKSIIYQYALRTARLVVTYREVFGTEKIPSIMLDNAVVAATTMIEHLNEAGNLDEMRHEVTWLRHLIKSMELVQIHFPIIGRMLDSLKQICGSGPLSTMLSPVHRGSVEAARHHPRALSQSLDFGSSSNIAQEDPLVSGFDPGIMWDFFDTNVVPDLFASSGKASDSFVGLPLSESTTSNLMAGDNISNFPQAVP